MGGKYASHLDLDAYKMMSSLCADGVMTLAHSKEPAMWGNCFTTYFRFLYFFGNVLKMHKNHVKNDHNGSLSQTQFFINFHCKNNCFD